MDEIGKMFGITKERVRQLMEKWRLDRFPNIKRHKNKAKI